MESSPPHFDWQATQFNHDLFTQPRYNNDGQSSSSDFGSDPFAGFSDHLSANNSSSPHRHFDNAGPSGHARDNSGSNVTSNGGTHETWADFLRESNDTSLDESEQRNHLPNGSHRPLNYTGPLPHIGSENPFTTYTAHVLSEPAFHRPLTGFANAQPPTGSSIPSNSLSRSSYRRNLSPVSTREPLLLERHRALVAARRAAIQERIKKRRLTDSAQEGRESTWTGQAEGGGPRPRMSEPSIIDLTSSPPAPPRRDNHGRRASRVDPSLERRRSSLNAGSGGSMRLDQDEPQQLRDETALHLASNTEEAQQPGDVVLPVWQPDAEVTKCPVCGNHFGFFYRKHHCRKCGRVVCANCSPHRITMPREYIVQPPTVIDLTGEDGDSSPQQPARNGNSALGGGAQVRVCNPCVPDPNLNPPPQYLTSQPPPYEQLHDPADFFTSAGPRGRSSFSGRQNAIGEWPNGNEQQQAGPPSRSAINNPAAMDPFTSGRITFNNPSSASDLYPPFIGPNQRHPPVLNAPLPPPPFSRPSMPNWNDVPRDMLAAPRTSSRPSHRSARSTPSMGAFGPPPAPGTLRTFQDQFPSGIAPQGMAPPMHIPPRGQRINPYPPGHPRADHRADLPPPPPRRQVAEEDECPVCGNEYPTTDPTEREAHVIECIEGRLAPSGPSRTAGGTVEARPDPTLPQNFPAGSSSAPSHLPPGNPLASSLPTNSPAGPSRQRSSTTNRRNQMLVYKATEKDCQPEEEGGDAPECIICFEEFEPGVELGRMECLCKFHRGCIKDWWARKGVGSCPTHQLHD